MIRLGWGILISAMVIVTVRWLDGAVGKEGTLWVVGSLAFVVGMASMLLFGASIYGRGARDSGGTLGNVFEHIADVAASLVTPQVQHLKNEGQHTKADGQIRVIDARQQDTIFREGFKLGQQQVKAAIADSPTWSVPNDDNHRYESSTPAAEERNYY